MLLFGFGFYIYIKYNNNNTTNIDLLMDGHFLKMMAILDLAKKSVYRVDEFRNKYILMYYYNLL